MQTITVSATATENLTPDTATVTMTVSGNAKNYSLANDNLAAASEKVLTALKNKANAVAKSRGITCSAQYKDGKVVGYCARQTLVLALKTDDKRLSSALDTLTDCQCEWFLAYSHADKPSDALLARAVEIAREKAEIIAKAAGLKLGAMQSAEHSATTNRPMLMRAAVNSDPEELPVSESVTCVFAVQ